MDKSKAIELLKQCLNEVPKLRELHHDNQDFILWIDNARNIIKAALTPDDLKRFKSNQPGLLKGLSFADSIYQENYLARLTDYETALKSILQKYELPGIEEKSSTIQVAPESIFQEVPPKAFISHGKNSAALNKLTEFLDTLGIECLVVKKRASLDKDVPDKVNLYLSQADFVIILATGDDAFDDKQHPRQNVIHEIGLAQKTRPGRIIYLLEEGTEFPSNILPKVWESFKQRNMMSAFLGIIRELRAYGMLKIIKTPPKEHKP